MVLKMCAFLPTAAWMYVTCQHDTLLDRSLKSLWLNQLCKQWAQMLGVCTRHVLQAHTPTHDMTVAGRRAGWGQVAFPAPEMHLPDDTLHSQS